LRIEDYGLIGDMQAAALVGRDGAVDWLCLPRFDSPSCLSALLGDERHGRWRIAPTGEVRGSARRYRPGTLVLETDVETFPEQLQGEISGLSRSVSNLGSSFGTAIAGTILVSDLASGNRSYSLAMLVLAGIGLIGLGAALLLPGQREPGGELAPAPSTQPGS
jgi:hypothetical protein